jgi:two-component system, LytTR family, response regulator
MKCLIVDDNKIARMAMRQLVSQVKDLELSGECENAIEAYNLIHEKQVDLLLLDIEMPGMTGIELTKNFEGEGPLIIFTTAKADYAVEAFELNVVDYLVKPVQLPRFIAAVERARETFEVRLDALKIEQKDFVFVKDNGILKRVPMEDILFVEAMGDYIKVHTTQKYYIVHATLKSVEEKIPLQKFMRVHRSYIVALNRIDFIEEGVINIGKTSIPVADAYRGALTRRLNLL